MVVDVLAHVLPLLTEAADCLETLDIPIDLDLYDKDVVQELLVARHNLANLILDLEDVLNEL